MTDDHRIAQGDPSPENIDFSWRYLALTGDRVPIKGMTAQNAPGYWDGLDPDWGQITDWVKNGNSVGILPERSGLVILDCDSRKEWKVEGSSATIVRGHGIDDLKRVAQETGQDVPATFTVRTKSDGFHLYYRQNQVCPVQSRGHRDRWRIDVKASRNTYAVAPPTPGYSVVRDLPVAELPLWLAHWIQGLYKTVPPLGGENQRRRMEAATALKYRILLGGTVQDGDLFGHWCQAMLNVIVASNQYGGWNNAVYLTAHEFFDVGLSVTDVMPMILEAAAPYNEREERTVRSTVESAWRKHTDLGGHYSGYADEIG